MIITCIDSCCLMNLLNSGFLIDLAASNQREFYIQGLVEDEMQTQATQVQQMISQRVLHLISGGSILASEVDYIASKYNLGLGESECIAIGKKMNIAVASDDKRARTAANYELGQSRVTGSIGLLREAVIAGNLRSSDAFQAYRNMRASGAFLPRLASEFFQP